jgi:hypothetical protein
VIASGLALARLVGDAVGPRASVPPSASSPSTLASPELRLLHRCFDNWRGSGDVVAGMARQRVAAGSRLPEVRRAAVRAPSVMLCSYQRRREPMPERREQHPGDG